MQQIAAKTENTKTRPPIVVVMGHIDHGKTKILDWYRKTKVVEQESGGITQAIGAFQVEIPTPPTNVGGSGPRPQASGKITFIDTPGHEAFSKMRSRGAKVADLAVLVVAADEGVKPQTKEAIRIIQENNLPFVVALNKIDKPEANAERVKQQLAEENILVESYGGKVPVAEISAKTGQNMDGLLEILLLLAELEDLKIQPEKAAEGVVIEAHLDPKRGITATLLVQNGTIIQGDILAIGRSLETIKILEDFLGRPAQAIGPSSPLRAVGLSATPIVGDTFRKFDSKKEAEDFIKSLPVEAAVPIKTIKTEEEEKPIFNIIIKADVAGSKEALEESLKKIATDSIGINILKSEVGNIGESDVKLALATKLVTIVGFKVKMDASVRELAERANIRIVLGEVIYEVLDDVKKKMQEMIPPIIKRVDLGKAKVLKVFSAKGGATSGGKKDGNRQIIGGRVEEGVIRKGAHMDIKRFKDIAGTGSIIGLQKDKQEAEEVGKGAQFGILAEAKTAIEEGDVLEIFIEETIQRTL